MRIAIAFLSLLSFASAQEVKIPPGLDKLAAKAKESVNVTLEGPMLEFANRALSDKDPNQAAAKKLVSSLKGIYVRSFEFDKEGQYSMADVEEFRAQLRPPAWAQIVSVKSKTETDEVYFKASTGGEIGGLVVIAAEPTELTVVNIIGTLKPEDLASLSGQFGIPKVDTSKKSKDAK